MVISVMQYIEGFKVNKCPSDIYISDISDNLLQVFFRRISRTAKVFRSTSQNGSEPSYL